MNADKRTRLVEEVKAIGQEIIDRAEDIVGEGDLICDLTLMASFSDGPEVRVPTLEITREQYSKHIHKLYMEGKIV